MAIGGLGSALSNALSGLNVSQQSLSATSGNITNANTDGYSRKVIQGTTQVVSGLGVGASTELKRIVDEFLTKAQRGQATSTAKAQVVRDYMDRLQVYLGKPGEGQGKSIMSDLDKFFSAMADVSSSPEQPFFRTQAIQAATSLAHTISSLSSNLQKTRYQADQDIYDAVTQVNLTLDRLAAINKAVKEAYIAGQPQSELFDKRDTALKELSSYLDIGVTYTDAGEAQIFNQAGELLSTSKYHLSYVPTGGVEAFEADNILAKIQIIALKEDGTETNFSVDLSTEGRSSEVTTKINDGKIKGLLEVRDLELPRMLAQLDSLANGLRDEIDKIQNAGVGFPPPSSLTGTNAVRLNQELGFTGIARIAALAADGTAAISPFSGDTSGKMRPLNLDFSKIYGPTGIGKPTVADVIKEINEYYGPASNRATMGPLADTRIVAISDTTAGPFQFDVEFENPSANALNITIVTVNGVAAGNTLAVQPGTVARTSPTNTYSIAGVGPYSIDVEIQFTDPDTGAVFNDTITYTVPAAASGARGDRYSVAAVSGAGNASIVTPTSNADVLTAQIVDANGNIVTNPAQPAYLQLIGENGNRIGIDELTSIDEGVLSTRTAATNRGFSHYFQLNNFFEPNTDTTLGSAAQNFIVKQALIDDPNLLAAGSLTLASQPTGTNAQPLYAYNIAIGSNQIAERFSNLRDTHINFVAAGTLPAFSNSVSSYASEIYAYIGGVYNSKNNELTQQQIVGQSYDDRLSSVAGVNLDEELANTVLFQNAYAASARIITVVSTLFDKLLEIRS